MGSSARRKSSGLPDSLARAGRSASTGVLADDELPEELSVPLVDVDGTVAAASYPGDSVRVFHEAGLLGVECERGFIGNVAPHFVAAVKQARLTRGSIETVERDPLVILVLLRR